MYDINRGEGSLEGGFMRQSEAPLIKIRLRSIILSRILFRLFYACRMK